MQSETALMTTHSLLSRSLSASLSLLKPYLYSRGLRTGSATEWSRPLAALYKFRTTIRDKRYQTTNDKKAN